ncbi:MAG: metallophosphoesterase [Bacillota bacterium]
MNIIYIIIVLFIIYIIYFLYKETTEIKLEKVKIYSDKINNKIKILQLSDIHFKREGKKEKKIQSLINEIDYDLLVFTGDYVLEEKYFNDFQKFIQKLDIKKPAYAVTGNHEILININNLKDLFKENNIKLLLNDAETLEIKEEKINIIGVENPDAKYFEDKNFKNILKPLDTLRNFNLVLSHKYDILDHINNSQNIDLVLAGDTHGGQVNISYLSFKLLKKIGSIKYLKGKHKINNLTLYVNRGIGTSLFPVRFNSPPEITLIEIE